MGWTVYCTSNSPAPGNAERAEIMRLCTSEHLTPLAASKVGSTWYVAIRSTYPGDNKYERAPDGSFVFAVVFLTSRKHGAWGYKDMDESMGPNESRCPARVLDMLSPLKPGRDGYAADWRARCREQRRSPAAAFKVGDRVRLATLPEIDGTPIEIVTVASYRRGKRNMRAYHAEGVGLFRMDASWLRGAERIT